MRRMAKSSSIQILPVAMALLLAGSAAWTQPNGPSLNGPPDGFPALGTGPQLLRLCWDGIADASGYEVRVRRQGEAFGQFSRVCTRNQLSFGTTEEGQYEWQVRCLFADPNQYCATSEECLGPWSHLYKFGVSREATGSPAGPGNPRWRFPQDDEDLVDGNRYQFRWDPEEGAFQYQVCHETPSGTRTCQIVDGCTFEFRSQRSMGPFAHGEPEEGIHQLQVRSIGEAGPGPWGEPIQFRLQSEGSHGNHWQTSGPSPRPALLIPDASATLRPTADGLVGVFAWEPVDGAVAYELKFQTADGAQPRYQDHGLTRPPSSVLTEDTRYALVIPEAVAGTRYAWQVRAVFQNGEEMTASRFSTARPFVIGPAAELDEIGSPVVLVEPEDGSTFTGPDALVPFEWNAGPDEILCQIAVRDADGNLFAQNYLWTTTWNAQIVGLGAYTWQVRTIAVGEDGTITGMGPAGESRSFTVGETVEMAGARAVGDLVFDGSVDSGDAIRALQQSTERDRDMTRLHLRDNAHGDCNGDGAVDSGDAVYMLRKAVASGRD